MLIVYVIVCLGTEFCHVAQTGLELPIHLPEPQQPCLMAHLKSKAVPRDPVFSRPSGCKVWIQVIPPPLAPREFCTPSRSQMACGALNQSHSLIITHKFNFHILRVVNNLKVILAFSPTPASVWKHIAGASGHSLSISDGPLPFPLLAAILRYNMVFVQRSFSSSLATYGPTIAPFYNKFHF